MRLDIVLVGILEISHHIPSIIFKVLEPYDVEHVVSIILVYKFGSTAKKGRLDVIDVSVS